MKTAAFVAMAILISGCAMKPPPGRIALSGPAAAAFSSFAAPSCGARIFVSMGTNQKFPTNPGLRIPEGELYVDGVLTDRVSSNPEVSVIDVPAGKVELSWMVSSYGDFDRSKTKQNKLLLSLANRQTAFVVLDWHDDTPAVAGLFGPIGILATVGFRTEVVETRDTGQFAGKRTVFHRALDREACTEVAARAQNVPTDGFKETKAGIAGNGYRANAVQGAPAFASEKVDGAPLHVFADGERITVVESLATGWLRVLLPSGSIGYVPKAVVRLE